MPRVEWLIRGRIWGCVPSKALPFLRTEDCLAAVGIHACGEFPRGRPFHKPPVRVFFAGKQPARTYFDRKVVDSANLKGMKPIYWDADWNGKDGFQLFDRNTAGLFGLVPITRK